MEVLGGRCAVIVLSSEDEAAAFARYLVQAVRYGWTARSRTPPRLLLDVTEELSRVARGSAAPEPPPRRPAGTAEPQNPPLLASLPASELETPTVTVTAAARAAEVSTSYVRRMIRVGVIDADDHQSAYAVHTDSLAAWADDRRRKRERRKAS